MIEEFKNLLYSDYQDYVNNVSTPEMAASLECSVFLLTLCNTFSPKTVVDLGSGFSSFALRKYRNKYNKLFSVMSVDTNKDWLEKTGQFIKDKDIECSNLVLFEDFIKNTRVYDLILYDIAYYQNGTRQQLLPMVLQKCVHSKTNILFDDVHVNHYFMFVIDTMSNLKFNMVNTRPYTIDNLGRFSLLFNGIDNV